MNYKFSCICGNFFIENSEKIRGIKFIECPKCKKMMVNPVENQARLGMEKK